MARILSALVLMPVFFGAIWWLPSPLLLVVAELVLVLGFVEYAGLAEALGARLPRVVSAIAAMGVCAALGLGLPLELPLVAGFVALAVMALGSGVPSRGVLADVAVSALPMVYLGVPVGTIVALHATGGRLAVLLLLVTVIVSDTAQYCTGRLFGRHRLSPAISPKKTVEGALGAFVLTPVVMVLLGRSWLPGRTVGWMLVVAIALVALGIAGDLFESLVKRSAGVKDSSALIPGHGGVLDRIDALLFAAPVFYVLVRYGW